MSLILAVAAGFTLSDGTKVPILASLPEWMAGCWVSETEKEWAEECWMPPRGGVMLGSNRSGTKGASYETANWEMMQIGPVRPEATSGARGLAFRASLRGSEWTAFELAESELPGMTFVNAAHDYPQRIRYWREGEKLRAEISLADGSQPMQWTFSKALE